MDNVCGPALYLVRDISPGADDSDPDALFVGSEVTYFVATQTSSPNTGKELWRTDGTTAGTVILEAQPWSFDEIDHLTNASGTLYFTHEQEATGRELWKTDGTVEGTEMVTDLNPGAGTGVKAILGYAGGRLYLRATDGQGGYELWALIVK